MKKSLLASGIALVISSATINSHAEEGYYDVDDTYTASTTKESVTIGTAGIIGGALAGPIGFMAGSIGGSFMASELMKAEEYELAIIESEEMADALSQAEKNIALLEKKLAIAQAEQQHNNKAALTTLELQLLFHTGEDTIDANNTKRLDELARFLHNNHHLNVYLHGHADPRGTDEYNNVLSMHRTINVQAALIERGIDTTRITRQAYGANKSQASQGNLDEYALERRVSIEILNTQQRNAITMAQ